MKNTAHVCCVCGHKWKSIDGASAKSVRAATLVNGEGPHCNLCYHLTMAARFAKARNLTRLVKLIAPYLKPPKKTKA